MAAQVEKKSSFLTAKQRSDLHGAVLDYLSSESRFSDSAAAFRREAGLSQEGNDATSRECGQLVRKWTSIVRLSRQVQDLQKRAEAAELIVKSARLQDGGVSGVSRGRGDAGGGAGSESSLVANLTSCRLRDIATRLWYGKEASTLLQTICFAHVTCYVFPLV